MNDCAPCRDTAYRTAQPVMIEMECGPICALPFAPKGFSLLPSRDHDQKVETVRKKASDLRVAHRTDQARMRYL